MLSNYIVSLIRTGVPVVIGTLLTWLATTVHIIVDPTSQAGLVALCVAVLTALYYALARLLESKFPNNPIFKYLLVVPAAPQYSTQVTSNNTPVVNDAEDHSVVDVSDLQ